MKKLLLVALLIPSIANAISGKEACFIAKERREFQDKAVELMRACMQRGDGVKDWTDADDQVQNCKNLIHSMTATAGIVDYHITEKYTEFLAKGGDRETCKYKGEK